ncbi:MATE family efflux transporter [Eggerthella lenta]|uniref:MATE family efflux transporter n=1 Tax=Eggerthella lenta TaxID=84112 RepID=A0A5C5BSA3_EGGLN|nr:MATE family efflux transporter [Eggerthella lenta]TNU89131.1 MATE family efflux transporter [Eggerthella lenta]
MARQVLQQDKRALMLTQTPGKLMMSLSLPAIVGMAVIGLYTFMDAVYAGQLIGMEAMGAVAVAYPFTFINSGGASMIGMGSASVLSRAIGAKDQRTIDQVMGNLVVMNLVLSLTVTIVGTVFARPLLALTGAQGQVLDLAESYLRIMLVGSLFVNFAQSSNMVMRGKGELARAMAIMGGGAVLNMVLAPLFILALRDQGLGIQGAGCATVITQMIQAGVMLWWFVKREKTARIVRVAVSPAILPEVLKVGASAMLMQVLVLVQQAIAYRAAAAWGGAEWQVLLGAALRIQAFAFIPLWGMSNGLQPAAGTNYGAGLYGRVRKLTIVFCLGSMALALLFWVPAMLAPEATLSLLVSDPAVAAMGADDFRVFFSTYLVAGPMVMGITLLQALGQGGKAAILTFARPVALFVPLVLILPNVAGLGIHGVWAASALSDGVMIVVAAFMVASVIRNLGKDEGSAADRMTMEEEAARA